MERRGGGGRRGNNRTAGGSTVKNRLGNLLALALTGGGATAATGRGSRVSSKKRFAAGRHSVESSSFRVSASGGGAQGLAPLRGRCGSSRGHHADTVEGAHG